MENSTNSENSNASTSFLNFNPNNIPYQYEVLEDLERNFDYKEGMHEVLLSGSVGSAKSILMAHIAVKHCVKFPGALICLCRKTMPDLKATIFKEILDHMEDDFIEGEDYNVNRQTASIVFANGSGIISRSWADKKYKSKFRSLKLSGAIFEELTENNEEDKEAYMECKARIGRNPLVRKENFMLSATNPDSPAHWVYDYFIENPSDHQHVYYSVTTDNPYLPAWYKTQLEEDMDERLVQRLIYGRWIELTQDVIYYAYDKQDNFVNETYKVDERYPIHFCWDFNIGMGKPFSVCFFQHIKGIFHFFNEIVVEGQRTEDILEEAWSKGLLDYNTAYIINGDATGRRRDTRSPKSDYDIISSFFDNARNKNKQRIYYKIEVPRDNPRLRDRHNRVNAQIKNSKGKVSLLVYKECVTLDKGFRLTRLKKAGQYLEDDSAAHPYQHITTAAGYGIMAVVNGQAIRKPSVHNR